MPGPGAHALESLIPSAERAAAGKALPALENAAQGAQHSGMFSAFGGAPRAIEESSMGALPKAVTGKGEWGQLPKEIPEWLKNQKPAAPREMLPLPASDMASAPPAIGTLKTQLAGPKPLPKFGPPELATPATGGWQPPSPEEAAQRLDEARRAGLMGGKWGDEPKIMERAMMEAGHAPPSSSRGVVGPGTQRF